MATNLIHYIESGQHVIDLHHDLDALIESKQQGAPIPLLYYYSYSVSARFVIWRDRH